jgi:hypothetical protein
MHVRPKRRNEKTKRPKSQVAHGQVGITVESTGTPGPKRSVAALPEAKRDRREANQGNITAETNWTVARNDTF